MLRNSFVHIPGLGHTTERSLWTQGCRSWTDYLAEPTAFSIGSASRSLAQSVIEGSVAAAERLDAQFFSDAFSVSELWRLWPDFRPKTVYLDIETDGRNSSDAITTVGM
ncbi:MAG: exonuclease, partial [Armatimonadota bacterium]